MRRLRFAIVAVAIVLLSAAALEVAAQGSGTGSRGVLTRVYTCGTTLTTLASSNPNRLNLTLINVGTIHVGLSGQMHSGATINADGLFTLHSGSAIEFANYTGGLVCNAAGSVRLNVIEEIR